MRAVHVLIPLFMLLSAPAIAQDAPDAPDAAVPAEVAPAAGIAVGDTVFALADTPSTRFPDAEEEGPTFTPGSKLVVLVAEAGRLRVMSSADNSFGWIPESTVTAEKPEIDMDALLKSISAGATGAGGGMGGAMGGGL